MNIQENIKELKSINVEIKRLTKSAAVLRKKAKQLEKDIIDYLNHKEQPGVKFQDTAIILENKYKREGKKKQSIEEDSLQILRDNGISDPQNVLKEIIEARKGREIPLQKIKIQQIKNKK